MIDKSFIFLTGHHRSGTSLVHEIMKEHPEVSGLCNTGVPKDEGQHVQTVYQPTKPLGGPGKYIFNPDSKMTEDHPLATRKSAEKVFQQWQEFYDSSCEHYIEKSPTNLIRTRFFQKLFPNSKFVVILRHPLAIGYATKKWSKTSIKSLLDHTLLGYEIFSQDLAHLNNVYVFRYEDFVLNPQAEINKVYHFLGLQPVTIKHTVNPKINDKYFQRWLRNRLNPVNRILFPVDDYLEQRANAFGYSIRRYRELLPCSLLGQHNVLADQPVPLPA